jgi:hypothetical protein
VNKFLIPVAFGVILAEMLLTGPKLTHNDEILPHATELEIAAPVDDLTLAPRLIVEGLEAPTDVVGAPGDDRLFVVEKPGRVRVVVNGAILADPYVDLSTWVNSTGNEQGMLSFLFHPDYETNRRVFLFFTDTSGTSKLIEMRTSRDNPNRADPGSLRLLMSIPQYGQYHQSGSMFFGPDGYLWLSLGDGGGIGDPNGNGQDRSDFDASILRIDVDHGYPYSIPDDNPFVDGPPDAAPELWAYGLRNPWRITYDEATGLVYIPDVGQEGFEELNVVPVNEGGNNFGWSVSEGTGCYNAESCDMEGQTMPVYMFAHNGNGCAIIGGRVYRGDLMPQLRGHYFLADYCLGWIRSVVADASGVYLVHDWTKNKSDRLGTVSTIGSDRHGELYAANLEGQIWRLELASEDGQ